MTNEQPVLLSTKVFIPSVTHNLVQRPRLTQRLNDILFNKLTLVSAPAGFGKTTLVSQWIHDSQPSLPAAWLSIEEGENDPVRFWDYFISALRVIQPALGENSIDVLHSSEEIPVESALIMLINDIAASPRDFVLVLDDYHFIQSQSVHHSLAFFLEHIPRCMHLVITTRVDPPLPLTHFRGKGTLLEIRADDLRFTREETSNLLAVLNVPALSTENANALNDRAEGWVVGLKMAALTMIGKKDVAAFVASFTGSQRYIMDYLMEEVLQRQPSEIRNFLLQTSVLHRLNGSLCEYITGHSGSQETLEIIKAANLFLVPLDNSGEWYRYEHLFADLLFHRLQLESGKEMAEELQKKASYWFEQNGYKEDAINHSLAARDWTRALDLILNLTPNLINAFGVLTTYNWLRLMPEDILLTRERACRYYVYVLANTGHLDQAKVFLDRYEKAQAGNVEQAGYIATSRAQIAFIRGDSKAEEYTLSALSLLPSNEILERTVLSGQLGVHYLYRGRIGEAEPLLTKAYDLHRENNNNVSAGFTLAFLAAIAVLRGKLRQAEEMSKRAIQMSGPYTERPGGHVVLGWVYYIWNDLAKASIEFERATELSVGSPWMTANNILNTIPIKLAQGDIQAATTTLEEVERGWSENFNAQDRATIAGYQMVVAEATGDDESVSRWLDKFCEYSGFILMIPTSTICLLHERGHEAGKRRLRALYEASRKENLQYYLIIERINQAISSSESEEALSLISNALAMGKPEGFIRIFTDWGISLAPLLRQVIRRGVEPEYARKLLDIIETEDRQRRSSKGEMLPISSIDSALSEREITVLKLLAEGLSNQEIAQKLIISTNTAKAHVRHILQKLDARDRLGAVVRARELKLI